jgi:hypothetical protein
MVLRRGMRSPVKAAARTAMSTGFSFAPARRRSREAQGALEPAADGDDVGDGGCAAGWLRRHVVEGRLQASQALCAGREGRKPPAESDRYTPDRSDSIGPPRGIGAATPTNLRWLRHPLRCPQIAELESLVGSICEEFQSERNWSAVPQNADGL